MQKLRLIILLAILWVANLSFGLAAGQAVAGQTDTHTITTTPYKAFTGFTGSVVRRASLSIWTSLANTSGIYVVYLPSGTTAPANLAAMKAYTNCYLLNPGDQVAGGTSDTNFLFDVWACAASGSQSAMFAEGTYSDGHPVSTFGRALIPTQTQDYNPLRATVRDLSGSGTPILVSFEDSAGTPIPLTDSSSVSYDAVSISVPASTTWGLSWAILNQCKPDGTHLITSLPSNAASIRITVTGTGSSSPVLSLNFGGTADGSAGTGSYGFATGYGASAYTPIQLYQGEQRVYGKVRG